MTDCTKTLKIEAQDGPMTVVFGEATTEQRPHCHQLATHFRLPLSETDYLAREDFLGQHPLTRGSGCRLWCLARADNPNVVVATCKTIRRDLIIRDIHATCQDVGYCVSSVVTDARYRRLGLASCLMKNVAKWMDGQSSGAASMLYTSIGKFYARRGWRMLPAFQSVLSISPSVSTECAGFFPTRPLTKIDIPRLCSHDLECLKTEIKEIELQPTETLMSVLPTADLGAICEHEDSWVYWFHDFRKQKLVLQRVRVGKAQATTLCLASLFLAAVIEARTWGLPNVVVWTPDAESLLALDLLAKKGFEVISEERDGTSIPSVRWAGGDESIKTVFWPNEFFAWS
ncbi:uncharacterized protein BCR38DRAFT_459839 [Pseudomassariella vexata]|uniref:LYC1 C-terminal domain-containing protein n=1 Tax=Pseudomassariella vexata TaxID=1141098 RepID=A0A1Y2DNV6_9PEZI|nr:uncharacterized protein BCR38DRAFT_459839 [Pseudomassariella vexata]ORY60897.1 hypothetical protein BCR38DRAFT_459839 [Pseudomassariella vexata]